MSARRPDRVVVVGGGIGGVSTVAALRSGGFAGDLVLIDRAELPYDRPPLSKDYLAGERDLKQIALQPAEWYDDQRVELLGLASVVAIAPGDDIVAVELADGRSYVADHLVLATGGRPLVPPIPGLSEVEVAGRLHVLRDADHADRLRAAMTPGARLLVVGAGLIGAETASIACKLGCEVVLVDPLDPPLAAAGRDVATWLHTEHRRRGIDTRTTTVASLATTRAGVVAGLGDGATVEVDAVLVGVGMVPNTQLAEAACLEVERGIVVDERQRTSHPRILAVGDAAQRRGERPAEHWEAAHHDGQRAAATLLEAPASPTAATAPWWWSDRHDLHVEVVGAMRSPDGDHTVVVRGTLGYPPFSAFTVREGKVVGAVAVADPHAVRAARRLIDRGITVDPARLADTETDLRKLLRG